MIDDAFSALTKQVVNSKPRRLVTLADVLAVAERESEGVPIFQPTDLLYHANLQAAQRLTGLSSKDLITAATIPSGKYQGQISKFRCEPGYWVWASKLKGRFTPAQKFLLASSIGVGQKMARWLVTGTTPDEWITIIHQFMGSVPTQVLYIAGDIDNLLTGAGGDRKLAYTRYNAGPNTKHVTEYGLDVFARYERFRGLVE